MSQISLGEKLAIIWKMISSSYIYLIVLGLFVFLGFLFMTTNGSNKKQSKKTYALIYIFVFLAIVIQYGQGFASFFDYLMNHLFVIFYFPNIAVYFVIIVATNIILWISIFSEKTDRNIKLVNSVAFCLLHYLLILVLGIVSQEKLDVFTLESLYSSQEAMSLIELSNLIFVLWILLLIIYKGIKAYQIKKGIIKIESLGGYELKSHFDVKKAYMKDSRIADFHDSYQANRFIEPPKLEVVKEEKQPDPFTLEDYKLLLELLREHQQKEQVKQGTFSSKQEEVRQEDTKRTQPLVDLEALYRSLDD